MPTRKLLLSICSFAFNLTLSNIACSMTPGSLDNSINRLTIAHDNLAEAQMALPTGPTDPLESVPRRLACSTDTLPESSRKKQKGALPNLKEPSPSDHHAEGSQVQLGSSTIPGKLPFHLVKTEELHSRDPDHAQGSASQSESQRFYELRAALLKWDEKHQHILNELSKSGSKGLGGTRIREKEKFFNLVKEDEKAEEQRAQAAKDFDKRDMHKVQKYLLSTQNGLGSRFHELLPLFPPGWQIAMMEVDGKSVVQLILQVIEKANQQRLHANWVFTTTEKRLPARESTFHQVSISVKEYIEKEFEEYSRLLLRILVQAGRNYRLDMSDVTVPSNWLASILFDEMSVISERISALQSLHSGELDKAGEHFMEATAKQAPTYELRRNLEAMGITTLDVEKDQRYRKLHHELKLVEAKCSSIHLEAVVFKLKEITSQRKELERYFAVNTLENRIHSREPPYWKDGMSLNKERFVNLAVEALGSELKAWEAALNGQLVKAHYYYIKAYKKQQKAQKYKVIWKDNQFYYFDLEKEAEYSKLMNDQKMLEREV